MGEHAALVRLTGLCHGLPEVTREDEGQHSSFRVRGKTFAWFLVDHHGDGIVGLVVKAPPGENEALIASDPGRFYRAAYLGPRGWVGLRLDTGAVDWTEVWELVAESYRLIAPKRLAASVGDRPPRA